jgi:hypothetical protein
VPARTLKDEGWGETTEFALDEPGEDQGRVLPASARPIHSAAPRHLQHRKT